ncbi:hypothetical protein E2320_001947, partial [Naja naja]
MWNIYQLHILHKIFRNTAYNDNFTDFSKQEDDKLPSNWPYNCPTDLITAQLSRSSWNWGFYDVISNNFNKIHPLPYCISSCWYSIFSVSITELLEHLQKICICSKLSLSDAYNLLHIQDAHQIFGDIASHQHRYRWSLTKYKLLNLATVPESQERSEANGFCKLLFFLRS